MMGPDQAQCMAASKLTHHYQFPFDPPHTCSQTNLQENAPTPPHDSDDDACMQVQHDRAPSHLLEGGLVHVTCPLRNVPAHCDFSAVQATRICWLMFVAWRVGSAMMRRTGVLSERSQDSHYVRVDADMHLHSRATSDPSAGCRSDSIITQHNNQSTQSSEIIPQTSPDTTTLSWPPTTDRLCPKLCFCSPQALFLQTVTKSF